MRKITNYQKQQLKMLFGHKVNLDISFESADKKICKKVLQNEQDLVDRIKNQAKYGLEGSSQFDRWLEDET